MKVESLNTRTASVTERRRTGPLERTHREWAGYRQLLGNWRRGDLQESRKTVPADLGGGNFSIKVGGRKLAGISLPRGYNKGFITLGVCIPLICN